MTNGLDEMMGTDPHAGVDSGFWAGLAMGGVTVFALASSPIGLICIGGLILWKVRK